MKTATTKIWPVRDNLHRVLEYAENHLKTANPAAYKPQELEDLKAVLSYAADGKKTEQEFFVSGVRCIPEIAFEQMTATKQRFGKLGGNLAYHAYQSFAPGEVTPEQCTLSAWNWRNVSGAAATRSLSRHTSTPIVFTITW
jgi:nucleotidyltransferase/DNA polymerase involved in DNA repair